MIQRAAAAVENPRQKDIILLKKIQGYARQIGEASEHADFGEWQIGITECWEEISPSMKMLLARTKFDNKPTTSCIALLGGWHGQTTSGCNHADGKRAAIAIALFLEQLLGADEKKMEPLAAAPPPVAASSLATASAAAATERTPLLRAPEPEPCCSCWPPCFLTTACVMAKGLPDNCEELTVLRGFRDGYVQALPQGEEIIAEYYRIAPGIVAGIEQRQDALSIFSGLYQDLVVRCVELIQEGRHEEALEAYGSWVRRLSAEYLDPIRD